MRGWGIGPGWLLWWSPHQLDTTDRYERASGVLGQVGYCGGVHTSYIPLIGMRGWGIGPGWLLWWSPHQLDTTDRYERASGVLGQVGYCGGVHTS